MMQSEHCEWSPLTDILVLDRFSMYFMNAFPNTLLSLTTICKRTCEIISSNAYRKELALLSYFKKYGMSYTEGWGFFEFKYYEKGGAHKNDIAMSNTLMVALQQEKFSFVEQFVDITRKSRSDIQHIRIYAIKNYYTFGKNMLEWSITGKYASIEINWNVIKNIHDVTIYEHIMNRTCTESTLWYTILLPAAIKFAIIRYNTSLITWLLNSRHFTYVRLTPDKIFTYASKSKTRNSFIFMKSLYPYFKPNIKKCLSSAIRTGNIDTIDYLLSISDIDDKTEALNKLYDIAIEHENLRLVEWAHDNHGCEINDLYSAYIARQAEDIEHLAWLVTLKVFPFGWRRLSEYAAELFHFIKNGRFFPGSRFILSHEQTMKSYSCANSSEENSLSISG